jgi:hypothetical protein
MKIISNFDTETIALFELSLLGQEIYLLENNKPYLFIPFYRLGHYDDKKGMTHTYHLGYIILEGVNRYKIAFLRHNNKNIDYESKTSYETMFDFTNIDNEITFEDLGLRTTGLVSISVSVKYSNIHIAYDFTSPNCAPTNYSEVIKDKEIKDFLLRYDLRDLRYLIHEIIKMG